MQILKKIKINKKKKNYEYNPYEQRSYMKSQSVHGADKFILLQKHFDQTRKIQLEKTVKL
jgi:hypothetical protein